jgi:hypothetical protein
MDPNQPIPMCTSTGKKRNNNFVVIPMDKIHSSLDKSNSSSTLQYSNFINRSRSTRVYQGQPSLLKIKQAGLTTAEIYFLYVGSPMSYQIILTNISGMKYYSVNHKEFVSIGYFKVSGLIPNNVYEVNVIAHYVSGDIFPVNFKKSFTTATALGAVKNIITRNPTNQVYTIKSFPYNTSFDILFVPLQDNADYVVNVKDVSDVFIPYDRSALQFITTIPDVSFNKTYEVSIHSLYGAQPDSFVYSANSTNLTLNENYSFDFSMVSIQNTSIDLSYSFVDISFVVYKLYLEDMCVKTDTVYQGVFHVSDLSINTLYGNTYVSVTYPNSGNEYKNRLHDFRFVTLNEGDATIDRTTIRNTGIDISFSNPYGDHKNIICSIFADSTQIGEALISTSNSLGSFVFNNLSINTEYFILVKTEYYQNNREYADCTKTIRTLNEGPIQNLKVDSNPNIKTTRLKFTPSPNYSALSTFEYKLYDSTNNLVQQNSYPFDTDFVDVSGLFSNSEYKIEFASVYAVTRNSYASEISFVTINDDINIYNAESNVSATNVTGDSVVLTLSKGSYYTSHDISYSKINASSNISIQTESWETYSLMNMDKDTSYNIAITSYFTREDEGYRRSPVIQVKTLNESFADITNIEISNDTAKITWRDNLDISYISMNNNTKAIDFSYIHYDLTINTSYDFSFSTIFKTSNTYVSDYSIKTLNEQAPTYFINTYFDTSLPGDTIARIEVQNTNQSNVSYTMINIGDESFSATLLDVSMINRFSSYSGNIVTTYNATSPIGIYTYKTKSYVTDFSFVTIMYKPVYTVFSDHIYMEWYDISSTHLTDVSYSILITENGGGMTRIFDLSHASLSYDIIDLSINTLYDISFIRRFDSAKTKNEFESIQTLNQGRAIQ